MWKYKITDVSEVNASGNVEVVFDILRGGNIVYRGLRVTTIPENYLKTIKQRALDLREQIIKRQAIQVGEEGEL